MAESSPIGQKTPWEKEKLLVMSKRLVLRTRKNKGFFGKGLKKTSIKCFTEQADGIYPRSDCPFCAA